MRELFTLANFVAGIAVIALNGYVLLGGADFGGGVWTSSLPARGATASAH